ncbi:uncharacterized protein LOC106647668 [Copidosoma floridanum]|uniref:uncharacterized protein LOC106647668 n=1 Tax=Copidosoma floridanum TaxID=29053 RepID=UPI0006C989BF|nr:uncharacterized protein LOC106647668 [Copidosoma floridanum]
MYKYQGFIEEITLSSDDSLDDKLVICDNSKSSRNNNACANAVNCTPALNFSTTIINIRGKNINESHLQYSSTKSSDASKTRQSGSPDIITLDDEWDISGKSFNEKQYSEKYKEYYGNNKESNSINDPVSNVNQEKLKNNANRGQHSAGSKTENCNNKQYNETSKTFNINNGEKCNVADSRVGINTLLLSLKKETFKEQEMTDEECDKNDKDVNLAMGKFEKVAYPIKAAKIRTKRFMRLFCTKCDISLRYQKKSDLVLKGTARCRKCFEILSYQCKICNGKFSSWLNLISHLKHDCIPDEFWRCVQCDYVTTSQDCLLGHVKKFHDLQNPERSKKTCKLGTKLARPTINREGSSKSMRINKRKSKKPVPTLSSSFSTGAVSREKDDVFDDEKSLLQYCAVCIKNTNIKKPYNNKNCLDCNSPLFWQCVFCDHRSKSYCGIFDHVQNECNKLCFFCDKTFSKRDELNEHQNSCSVPSLSFLFTNNSLTYR